MKIGIDLDSVLNALEVPWEKWIQETIDPNFRMEEHWVSWAIQDIIGPKAMDFLEHPGAFRNLPVKAGAQAAIQEMVDDGHEPFVITACIESPVLGHIIQDKLEWLKENFPQICSRRIIFTSQKHLIDVDLLIDDGAHNLETFPKQGLLFDRPWNRHATGFTRVQGWEDVRTYLKNNPANP